MRSVIWESLKIQPGKIVCIGRNYVKHIEELNNSLPERMVIFNKPNSAITNRLLYFGPHCRFEGEISFLIMAGQIVAVGAGLDLTRVDFQEEAKKVGLPWERAKAFDGSALFSAFVTLNTPAELLGIELRLNGELRQKGEASQMIHAPEKILKEVQEFQSLDDGDIIMSGTPAGVGGYQSGDVVEVQILSEGRQLTAKSWLVE